MIEGTKQWVFVMRGTVPPDYTEEQVVALVVANINVGLPVMALVRESQCNVVDVTRGIKLDA